ncbi:hypothetical protein GCM10009069_18420 [Algimonas arctica]|uniref:Lipoprotein n=1 Tax=Algimonas arctica TaxID=1479486 RepID=A0A8J3G2N9_9PROT|nr:hypothetical protein [Algimonas arctica]GHA95698.1 hypothetical protein GCM10009069_18420 [Algimonas arctica]
MKTLLSLTTLNHTACITVALFALSACATTETTTMMADASAVTTSAETTTKKAEVDDSLICKKTTVVGSKFNKRVCATQAQWDARAAADREATESIQRSKAPGVSN